MDNSSNITNNIFWSYSFFIFPYHLLLLILATLIILANAFILYIFMRTHSLRSESTNRLLANLAMSDLFTGAVTIPFTVASATLSGRPLINLHVFYFISNVLSDFCTIYSICSICWLIYDRYILVCKPFRIPNQRVKFPTQAHIFIAWFIMLSISIIPLSWSYDLLMDPFEPIKEYQLMAERIYVAMSTIFLFLIPSGFVVGALISMFKTARRLIIEESNSRQGQRTYRVQASVIALFIFGFVTFSLCWVPLMTVRTLDYFFIEVAKEVTVEALEVMFALRCTTSLINPFVYTLNDRDYKRAISKCLLYKKISKLLSRTMRKKKDPEDIMLRCNQCKNSDI